MGKADLYTWPARVMAGTKIPRPAIAYGKKWEQRVVSNRGRTTPVACSNIFLITLKHPEEISIRRGRKK